MSFLLKNIWIRIIQSKCIKLLKLLLLFLSILNTVEIFLIHLIKLFIIVNIHQFVFILDLRRVNFLIHVFIEFLLVLGILTISFVEMDLWEYVLLCVYVVFNVVSGAAWCWASFSFLGALAARFYDQLRQDIVHNLEVVEKQIWFRRGRGQVTQDFTFEDLPFHVFSELYFVLFILFVDLGCMNGFFAFCISLIKSIKHLEAFSKPISIA